jgi:hypothetical protein
MIKAIEVIAIEVLGETRIVVLPLLNVGTLPISS